MLTILRYGLMNAIMLAWIAAGLAGGPWGWAVYLGAALLTTVGDEHSGRTGVVGPRGRPGTTSISTPRSPCWRRAFSLTLAHVAPDSGLWVFSPVWSALALISQPPAPRRAGGRSRGCWSPAG